MGAHVRGFRLCCRTLVPRTFSVVSRCGIMRTNAQEDKGMGMRGGGGRVKAGGGLVGWNNHKRLVQEESQPEAPIIFESSKNFRGQQQNGGELTRWTPKLTRQGRNLRFLLQFWNKLHEDNNFGM